MAEKTTAKAEAGPAAPPPERPSRRGRATGKAAALAALLVLQAGAALFFVLDVLADWGMGWPLGDGPLHHRVELVAVLALLLGMGLTGLEIRRVLGRQRAIESQLRAAAGAFAEVVAEHFDAWGLTPSEREVALLALKGFSIAEIAALRGTRPGTVKAQLNAIYAKAGVSGRQQLMSLFVEELMGEGLIAALPGRGGGPGSARGAAPAGAPEARDEPEHHS